MSDWSEDDYRFMERAFELAYAQNGRTGKNPAVGCVIVTRSNKKIAEGWTGDGGILHAEESALQKLSGRANNCTMYVTLEPCRSRSSDKSSCSTLILQSGITHLVCAVEDLHPLGAGGINFLQAEGIYIQTGLMKDKGDELYAKFFDQVTTQP